MKNIFDETTIKNHKLKNRIFRSATWMAMADNTGHLNDKIYNLYSNLSQNEVAAIITGITSIYDEDQKVQGGLSFDNDSFIEEHKKLTSMVHDNETLIFLQIAIADVFTMYLDETINNLTIKEIEEIENLFVQSAIRAQKAGYDGVQIHAAHLFFLSKFISTLYNNRNDEYGGNNIKRSHILVNIIQKIKNATDKDFIVLIKINATDEMEGGLELTDTIEICQTLNDAGIDAIEVSSNNTSHKNIKSGIDEGYFKDYAINIKDNVDVPVILVGGHRSIENMNQILNTTEIEYLSMSRPLICQPDLIKQWKNGNTTPSKCISCNSCYTTKDHICVLDN